MSEKTFDEKYLKTIIEMIMYLIENKLTKISLTVDPTKGSDWEFKLYQIIDKFSEEHPYCKRECDACNYGTHSQCDDPQICHDTDDKIHWVDLD